MITHLRLSFTAFACLLIPFVTTPAGEAPPGLAGLPESFKPTIRQLSLAAKMETKVWDTDAGLDKFLRLPTGPGNAATHYAALEKHYIEERDEDGRVRADGAGMASLLQAVEMKACTLTPNPYPVRTAYKGKGPNPVALRAYASALLREATAAQEADNTVGAETYLRAIVIMGWHFTEDRPTLRAFTMGLDLQLAGMKAWKAYLVRQIDLDRSDACEGYMRFLTIVYRDVIFKAQHSLGSWRHFESLLACRRVLAEDQDPIWRQEAVLNLWIMTSGFPLHDSEEWTSDPAQQAIAKEALTAASTNAKDKAIQPFAAWCAAHPAKEYLAEHVRLAKEASEKARAEASAKIAK